MIEFNGLSVETIRALNDEAVRAHRKHGNSSMIDPDMPVLQKFAALVEECGEVGTELTYDGSGVPGRLDRELLQVANVALTWYESRQRAGEIRDQVAALAEVRRIEIESAEQLLADRRNGTTASHSITEFYG